MKAFVDAANQSQRTDPVPNRADIEGYQSARWNAAVPEALRYDPVTNPKGARPTVFDAARNIYGVNPATGAALRPFDNVGVQYGLSALNSGAITVAAVPRSEREDRRLRPGRQLRRRRAPSATPARSSARIRAGLMLGGQRRADVDSDLRQRHVERSRRLSLRLVPLRAARAARARPTAATPTTW